jgi:hypothetical protein
MDWSEWRSTAGVAANLTSLALKFHESLTGKKPELRLEGLKWIGAGNGMLFSVRVSEIGNRVPAVGLHVYAELDGVEGAVHDEPPFNLGAGELDREVMFKLEQPKYGTTVPACNNEPTLYGRTLTVTAVGEKGGFASAEWHEVEYDPETNRDRWEAMQAARPSRAG